MSDLYNINDHKDRVFKCNICQTNVVVGKGKHPKAVIRGHQNRGTLCTVPTKSQQSIDNNDNVYYPDNDDFANFDGLDYCQANYFDGEDYFNINEENKDNSDNTSLEMLKAQGYAYRDEYDDDINNNDKLYCDPREEFKWCRYQAKISEMYERIQNIVPNKIANSNDTPDVKNLFAIVEFARRKGLSDNEGQELLDLIRNLKCPEDVSINVPLPTSFQTFINILGEKNIANLTMPDSLFSMKKYSFALDSVDPAVFPTNIFPNKSEALMFDIMETLSDALLHIDNMQNFITKPDNRTATCEGKNPERLYVDFTSGDKFKRFHDKIMELAKSKAASDNALTVPHVHVPLIIGVTLDETDSQRSGRQKFTPLVIWIFNAINNSLKLYLLGYVPKKLPYSDEQIMTKLRSEHPRIGLFETPAKALTKESIDNIIRVAKKEMYIKYLYECLSPILQYQESGFFAYVGPLANNKVICAYPHIGAITSDTVELEKFSFTSFQRDKCPCRFSLDCKRNAIGPPSRHFRNDNDMYRIAIRGKMAVMKSFFMPNKSSVPKKYSKDYNELETEIKSALQDCTDKNIAYGNNYLVKLFKWQFDNIGSGLYKSLPLDQLHLVFEGYMKYIVEQTVHIVSFCSKILKKGSAPSAKLDDRIKSFPYAQNFDPVRRFHFRTGLLDLFYSSKKKTSNRVSGFSSIEGYKMPALLLQILFSVEGILPESFESFQLDNKLKSPDLIATVKSFISPANIVRSTCFLGLDLYFCIRSKTAVYSQMKSLDLYISNFKWRLRQLESLRKVLIRLADRNATDDNIESTKKRRRLNFEPGRAIKPHYLGHLVWQKFEFGMDHVETDTMRTEHSHIQFAKKPYERTSKRYSTFGPEMMLNVKRLEYYSNCKKYFPPPNPESTNVAASPFIRTMGFDKIQIVNGKFIKANNKGFMSREPVSYFNRVVIDINTIEKLMLSPNESSNSISVTCDRCSEFNASMDECMKSNCDLFFAKQIKLGDNDLEEGAFNIGCGSSSFLEVRWADETTEYTELAQNCASIVFVDRMSKVESIYFLICWLERVPKKEVKRSFIPFPVYKFNLVKNSSYWFAIVASASVERGIFCIPYVKNSDNIWALPSYDSNTKKELLFYNISRSCAHRDADLNYQPFLNTGLDDVTVGGSHTADVFQSERQLQVFEQGLHNLENHINENGVDDDDCDDYDDYMSSDSD